MTSSNVSAPVAPDALSMIRWIVSLGMFAAFALSTAYCRRRLSRMLGPPWRTAVMIRREIFENALPRRASMRALTRMMLAKWL